MIAVSIVLIVVELWWASAFAYSFYLLRRRRLLAQVAQGLLIALFFVMLAINAYAGRSGLSAAQLLLVLLALLMVVLWRGSRGPELLRENYTNRLADVLRFRRTAVDMRRRVRTR